MLIKVKDFIWNIKAFIKQPIIPIKTMEWVTENNCSYIGESENGKWRYYWYGNFKTGHQVKIRVTFEMKFQEGYTQGYEAAKHIYERQ